MLAGANHHPLAGPAALAAPAMTASAITIVKLSSNRTYGITTGGTTNGEIETIAFPRSIAAHRTRWELACVAGRAEQESRATASPARKLALSAKRQPTQGRGRAVPYH